MISDAALGAEVGRLLEVLYQKRFAALDRLTLSDLLAKNPYLYRALGLTKPSNFIEQLLIARVSSSDETIFGNDFLEPLAVFAARHGVGHKKGVQVNVGAGAGQDIAIETPDAYLAVSVKSGKNIFNSQSDKGQSAEFKALQARLKKLNKMFRPIIGYGYGRKAVRAESAVEKLAGQAFWRELSGEEDFYLRISRAMAPFATEHGAAYRAQFERAQCRLLKQFMLHFVGDDGEVLWDALVAFNSSVARPARLKDLG
ncbi:PmeII family type II restriction endonuclease [Aquabacterium sp. OR-4]|uniref:PmeII family type II restriction endonuclease n=1 Tax=Aquabacterium sp. OR-4 TaxID=2978127 RepID=UPI0021B4979A|nr:PmeII family type II restriction endonuclease [Aquabacterium sp. OR-4]MDT7834073.1 PmeII family type II restriction endonuclease [Aquabacterium sp. OR-4]